MVRLGAAMKQVLAVSGLLGAVIALSLLLIPREEELALMHQRDKDYSTVRAFYEQRLAQAQQAGRVDQRLIEALARAYVQEGDLDSAIGLLESRLREAPDELRSRRMLADYYRSSARTYGYLRHLEWIAQQEPTADVLHELAGLYRVSGQVEKRKRVLRKLVERGAGTGDDLVDLAILAAQAGDYGAAVRTLQLAWERAPAAIDTAGIELMVRLSLDAGLDEQAYASAAQWLSLRRDARAAVRLANLIADHGAVARAVQLLEPYEHADGDAGPVVLDTLCRLWIAHGDSARAFARLQAVAHNAALTGPMRTTYIDAALREGEVRRALAVAARLPLAEQPDWLLRRLAAAALDARDVHFLGRFTTETGASFRQRNPVFVAQAALRIGDTATGHEWLTLARDRSAALEPERQLTLAQTLQETGRRDDALAVLQRAAAGALNDADWPAIARLYVALDAADQGLDRLEPQGGRSAWPSGRQRAWALLAAAAGAASEVSGWLAGGGAEALDDQTLQDLYFIAEQRGPADLMVRAASAAYARDASAVNRLRLARAWLRSDEPAAALRELRPLLPGSADVQSAYRQALYSAHRQGIDVVEELSAYVEGLLATAELPGPLQAQILHDMLDLEVYPPILESLRAHAAGNADGWYHAYREAALAAGQQSQFVSFLRIELERADLSFDAQAQRLRDLLEQGGDQVALPYLRPFMARAHGDWLSLYQSVLKRLDRGDELRSFLVRQMERRDLSAAERRILAYGALDVGLRDLAERLFWELAEAAPPDSPELRQLLFLWGPRPPVEGVDWLGERLSGAATDTAAAAWARTLTGVGAGALAALALEQRGIATRPASAAFPAYVDALADAGASQRLAESLRAVRDQPATPDQLRRYAELATAHDLLGVAQDLYRRVLEQDQNPQALRALALAAYRSGESASAARYLRRYIDLTGGDFETHYYYAEALTRQHLGSEARFYYQRALEAMQRASVETERMAALKPQLLDRLGRREAARLAYEDLLARNPRNREARLDFATALLTQNRVEQAAALLRH